MLMNTKHGASKDGSWREKREHDSQRGTGGGVTSGGVILTSFDLGGSLCILGMMDPRGGGAVGSRHDKHTVACQR